MTPGRPPLPYEFLPDVQRFVLTSVDIQDGVQLPRSQVSGLMDAGGEDISPQLAWSGFPAATRGFALTVFDPDAPTASGFWHWAVYNLPAEVTELAAGAGSPDSTALPDEAVTLRNDAGMRRYVGAAPPPGPVHRYFTVVTALDIPTVDVPDTASPALTLFQTLGNVVGRARLVPTFGT